MCGSALANPAGTIHYPDLQNLIPTNQFSIVQTVTGREFRYTHQIYNAGAGPLEILPAYNSSAGVYQGVQRIYTHDAAIQWSIAATSPIAGAFEFHAEHGHFHFPLAAFGLYAVTPSGGVGAPVTLSPKNGFCISDSFVRTPSLPHAGEFGDWGSCTVPTSLRGLSVGAVDEYDYRDPGQSVPIDGLPDGTYWFRALVDPYNYLVESNEANNETDVRVVIANNTVTAVQTLVPDSTPPSVDLTLPADGATLSESVALTAANLVGGSGVQFLVDGQPIGAPLLTPPYVLQWNSRSVTNGTHWLAARTENAMGIGGTSDVARVTVANDALPPGTIQIDTLAFSDGSGSRTASLTTTSANDVLLAFVAADGPSSGAQLATVSGGGLVWSLVRRANTQAGTSEIWTATAPLLLTNASIGSSLAFANFDQSLTVVALRGASGLGASAAAAASNGAPEVTFIATQANSWAFGVGNDWDNAIARTLAGTQTMQHQWVDSAAGNTFWVQSPTSAAASVGATVRVGATAPTADRWNMAAVEVLGAAAVDHSPPTLELTDPEADTTVSGNVVIAAIATDDVSVPTVRFYLDGAPIGAPVSVAPFIAAWDTRTASNGLHTLSATATDAAGNVGVADAIQVSVDNSARPPDLITVDVQASRDGQGTLVTAPFSTPAPGDLLVAFVAYDGPSGGTQTAVVSGAGLGWTLVKRSNAQRGTSEIWSAKATGALAGATVSASSLNGTNWYGSLTVIAFSNAAATGVAGAGSAPTGAPSLYVPGIAEGNWVFAVGNDWDGAVARTPIAGQVIVHERVETAVGDTFWVQSTAAPTTVPGIVEIRDTAPTNHQWNLAAVEIVATHSACAPGADPDADGICNPSDNCPTIANADQADGDADGVGTLCDNCTTVANPRVGATYLTANPWATLTGGQRDDDHDGYGNTCDADFNASFSTSVADTAQLKASIGLAKRLDTCGTAHDRPCAIFDINAANSTESSASGINASDSMRYKALFGSAPGPRCAACAGTGSALLPCAAGTAGTCN